MIASYQGEGFLVKIQHVIQSKFMADLLLGSIYKAPACSHLRILLRNAEMSY